ncbi:hypothetical protein NDU88_006402 [Pleurodeles waltl]|uniref:Uncharacterized protein n=1 Tax=Pleurodeles waltl TaxID=8319 RepID=A0AAV7VRG4_PLEWA|nr:hypothetical protein NDU88_006402 [Pleurodeles waltl]
MYKGRAKKADIQETLRDWSEIHPDGEAQSEKDLGQGEQADWGPEVPNGHWVEGEKPLDVTGLPGTGSGVSAWSLSSEELEDWREERKLRLELTKNAREQALTLAELGK